MKLFSRFLVCAALLIGLFAVAPEASARKERIRLTTLAPKNSSFHKLLMKMAQEWKDATDGQVELIVFAGGIQGGETAMIDRMRVNQTQAALISGIGLSEIDEAVAGLQKTPLLFRDLGELEHVMGELAPMLEERMEKKGFITLAWIDSGWVRIFSKSPVELPKDMQQGKLFTWTGDPKQTELLKNLGFRPIPIEATDIASSLQTGLIDTVPLPPLMALAGQVYRSAPYMLELNYAPLVGALVVSEQSWAKISPEHQKAVSEIALRIGAEMTASGREENEQSAREMASKWGLTVKAADPKLLGVWQTLAKSAYPSIRDNTVPAEVFDKVTQLLETHRAVAR